MKLRSVLIVAIQFCALSVMARDKTDIVVMKNGDRWTCEVKGLNSGVLYASVDYIDGTISVQWAKVARIESKQRFIVRTENGSVYSGRIKTTETAADQPVTLAIDDENTNVDLEPQRIVEVEEISEQFWRRFNGIVGLGLSYSKGNQATQYNFNSNVDYVRERWQAGLAYTSNLSANNGSETSTRNQLGLTAQRLLRWDNYFYAGFGDLLQSSTQGIDQQVAIGGAIGRYIKQTNRITWSVQGGLAYQATNYQPGLVAQPTQNVGTAMIATALKVFKFKTTNLNLTANLLPALTDPGRVYVITNASYYLKVFSNFNWNISFYGNWDSRPPAKFSGSDYGSTSGISWTFGNR